MRYLFYFLFLFSQFLFAESPSPSCTNFGTRVCYNNANACINNNQDTPGVNWHWETLSTQGCSVGATTAGRCNSGCTCPPGFKYNVTVNAGVKSSGCVPDEPTPVNCENGLPPPPGQSCEDVDPCPVGQVFYEGFCRDGSDSPDDCGSTYTTAIYVDGAYVCSNSPGCGNGTAPSVYTTAAGSWNVCGGDGNGSGSSSGSEPGAGSGSNTSSGSGSGDSDSGGDPGSGGGSGGGSGSGNNTAGGSTSSVSGGGSGGGSGVPVSSASNSSASGAASSGSGAGNCDPTAHDYLSCISRDHNPGEGNSDAGDFSPGGNKGSFDGEAAQTRKQELEQQIKDQMQLIRDEIKNEIGGDVRGSGGLSENCVTVYRKQVCFGLQKWQDKLVVIGQAIILVASVLAFGIVLSR